jgi:hypothetical protein
MPLTPLLVKCIQNHREIVPALIHSPLMPSYFCVLPCEPPIWSSQKLLDVTGFLECTTLLISMHICHGSLLQCFLNFTKCPANEDQRTACEWREYALELAAD